MIIRRKNQKSDAMNCVPTNIYRNAVMAADAVVVTSKFKIEVRRNAVGRYIFPFFV